MSLGQNRVDGNVLEGLGGRGEFFIVLALLRALPFFNYLLDNLSFLRLPCRLSLSLGLTREALARALCADTLRIVHRPVAAFAGLGDGLRDPLETFVEG